MSTDISVVWTQFPARIDVLTLHGMKDSIVSPYDALIYARAYGARKTATHTLRYIEDADHNYTGVGFLYQMQLSLMQVLTAFVDGGRGY